jgi:YegS/Rv2252/BmrU family lipid kinase
MTARTCLIANPTAVEARGVAPLLARFSHAHGWKTICTRTADDARDQALSAMRQGARRVIVAGGDGTVSRVVDGLADDFARAELGIVPLGTGNDLARSLGIPLDDPESALTLALEGEATRIDVVRYYDGHASHFINAVTAGLGGRVAADITPENKARWGAFAYWITAGTELTDLPEYDVRLDIDQDTVALRVLGLAIANGRFVGGGFPIARDASLNDGLLDVTVIPVLPTLELLAAGLQYVAGLDPGADRIRTFKARSLSVASTPPMLFSIDGEPRREIEAAFDVMPRALQVVAGPRPGALTDGRLEAPAPPTPTGRRSAIREAPG